MSQHGLKKSDYNGLLLVMEERLKKKGEDIDVSVLMCQDAVILLNSGLH